MPNAKTVVVTGVAGFIGSNLLRVLIDRGYDVIGIDNLANGFMRNIDGFLTHPRFAFQKADITDPATLQEVPDACCVVHLAAYKIPRYGNILDTLHVNLKGTENVLEFARRTNCKVMFASTSDVYGKNSEVPFKETDSLVLGESGVARWAYAVSKIYDEHLCFAHTEKYKTRVAIVRYFGGYGRNQHTTWWGGPQSVFIDAVLKGKPIEIHGDGLQTRSFTYVDDLVAGTVLTMESDKSDGEIFNIGDTREITIVELAEMIWRLMKGEGRPPLQFVPYSTFFGGKYEDVRRRIPEISKAKNLLGFAPTMELEEGLKIAIDWQTKLWKAGSTLPLSGASN
ncbi:MAG TPA: nucleoside-diphosphate sugar epimerase [Bacteroidetes bacterium]|jgi:UDP-glucose 4-epimerase|nr:nucleoside-diphosphate sugar epimerase [Bacteroidota bacterium]